MNIGNLIILFVIVGVVIVFAPDVLEGIVNNEEEFRATANLTKDLVAFLPFSGEELAGLILVAGILALMSKKT